MTATLQPPPVRDGTRTDPPRSAGSRAASAATTAVLVLALALVFVFLIGPLFLPYRITTTKTGSMTPTIPQGSLVVDRKVPASTLHAGDIITFNVPNEHRTVTHRIRSVVQQNGGVYFVTKGDANTRPDDWRIPATGDGYRVWFHIPGVGHLTAITRSIRGAASFVALLAVIAVAGGLLASRRTPVRSR